MLKNWLFWRIILGMGAPVVIVGTVALDTIETPHGHRSRVLGGSAVYAGIAARLFTDVRLSGIVGRDFPHEHKQFLMDREIDISGVEVADGDTFHWHGAYLNDLNSADTIQTDLNVLTQFNPRFPDHYQSDHPILFLANIDPVIQLKVIEAIPSASLIVMDTMNFWITHHREALLGTLKRVDVLVINDAEIRLLTGKSNLFLAIEAVLTMGPKRVIVKKGEHGSVSFDGTHYFLLPACPLTEVVDPTGAGDTFAGALVGMLAIQTSRDEMAFRRAMVVGTVLSAMTVQGFSVERLKQANRDDVESQVARFVSQCQVSV